MSYLSEEITFENYKDILLLEKGNKEDEIKTAAKLMIIFLDEAVRLFSKSKDYETIEFSEEGKLFRIKGKDNCTIFNIQHIEHEKLERISNSYFSLIESFIFTKHHDILKDSITRKNIKKLRNNLSAILVGNEINIHVDKELSNEYKKDIGLWNTNSFNDYILSVVFSLVQVNNYKKEKILHFNIVEACFSSHLNLFYSEHEGQIISPDKYLSTHNSLVIKNINLLMTKGSVEIENFIKSSDFLIDQNIMKLNDIKVNNISASSSKELQNQVKFFSIHKEKEKLSSSIITSDISDKKIKRI